LRIPAPLDGSAVPESVGRRNPPRVDAQNVSRSLEPCSRKIGNVVPEAVKNSLEEEKHLAQRRRGAELTKKIKQLFISNLCPSASLREIANFFTRSCPGFARTSATPGSGREKTADDRGDRFQLLGSRIRLHAEVLQRGRAEQVERIRGGEDDRARKRFVQLWDR